VLQEAGDKAEAAMRHVLVIGLLIGCVFSAVLGLAAPWLVQLFGMPEAAARFAVLFWIIPVSVATDLLGTATLFKRQLRYDIWARCIAEPGMQTIVAGACYLAGLNAIGLMASYGAAFTAACATALWGYSREFNLKATFGPVDPRRLIVLARNSSTTAVFDVLGIVMSRLDMFVVGHFFSAELVGLYGMVQQFLTLPDKIAKSYVPVVMPVLSHALHEGDVKRARAALGALLPRQAALEGILVLAFVVAGPLLLGMFGKEFVAAAPVLAILSLGQIVNDLLALTGLPLIAVRPGINPSASVASLIFYGIAIAIVQARFGIEGIAIISVTAMLAGNLWRTKVCYHVLFPRVQPLPAGE
jgi:O-antigen/teichoic acid export membrane protein